MTTRLRRRTPRTRRELDPAQRLAFIAGNIWFSTDETNPPELAERAPFRDEAEARSVWAANRDELIAAEAVRDRVPAAFWMFDGPPALRELPEVEPLALWRGPFAPGAAAALAERERIEAARDRFLARHDPGSYRGGP